MVSVPYHGEGILYRVCGIEEYEYPEAAWDCVVSNLALHYIENLNSIFEKVHRTLKKDGIFLFNIEHPVFTAGVGQDWAYGKDGTPLYWPIDQYFIPGERITHFLGCEVRKQHHTIALSINEGIQQNNFRQAGVWSHGTFKYLTEEQFEELKDDPLIESWGLRRFVGMPTEVPFNKSHVEIGYSDANQAHWSYCDPVEGRLPQEGTDEAATDTHVLKLLGVEPKIGAEFTVTFEVDGHITTQTFTLCSWWEYDEAVVANHILIPESRANAILAEVGVTPPGSDGMTGSWNLDVMLKNGARSIASDLEEILANHGYQSETPGETYISTGVNWGYTGAQLSDKLDPTVVAIIVGVLVLILLTGYLIIYNVFQISVAGDIRFYGLLKTIGTTPRQLRRIIRTQALLLSLIGIPIGLRLGLV